MRRSRAADDRGGARAGSRAQPGARPRARVLAPTTLALGALAAVVLAACGSPRRSAAIDGPLRIDDPDVARGRIVYAHYCHRCHPGGEAGLGPSLNEKPLPEFLIRFQVRHGLGAMPAFSERTIDAADLDRLVTYMKARRASG